MGASTRACNVADGRWMSDTTPMTGTRSRACSCGDDRWAYVPIISGTNSASNRPRDDVTAGDQSPVGRAPRRSIDDRESCVPDDTALPVIAPRRTPAPASGHDPLGEAPFCPALRMVRD